MQNLACFSSANAAACSSLLALPFLFFFCFFFNLASHKPAQHPLPLSRFACFVYFCFAFCMQLIHQCQPKKIQKLFPQPHVRSIFVFDQTEHGCPRHCFLNCPRRSRSCALGTAGRTKVSRLRWRVMRASSSPKLISVLLHVGHERRVKYRSWISNRTNEAD